ncbi:unnamed protein product [Meloidogyne enterolobii]|uniref:Uncharacterized protein n=1 Tax=Meloidogyne enterolobii TaxID=390850 RepID=A0ACB1ALB6_MELEN
MLSKNFPTIVSKSSNTKFSVVTLEGISGNGDSSSTSSFIAFLTTSRKMSI